MALMLLSETGINNMKFSRPKEIHKKVCCDFPLSVVKCPFFTLPPPPIKTRSAALDLCSDLFIIKVWIPPIFSPFTFFSPLSLFLLVLTIILMNILLIYPEEEKEEKEEERKKVTKKKISIITRRRVYPSRLLAFSSERRRAPWRVLNCKSPSRLLVIDKTYWRRCTSHLIAFLS